MGGDYEKTIETKTKAKAGARVELEGDQKLRVHVSGGEVHFHDDKAKLKAAVPVATWYAAWDKIRMAQVKDWTFIDAENDSLLSVSWGGEGDMEVTLVGKATNETFKKLDLLTRGK